MTDRRYFWCDGPSPLHKALSAAQEKQSAAVKSIKDLAKSLGARDSVGRDGFVSGFVFDETPPAASWKHAGTLDDGTKYYVPTKRSKEGRDLAMRMSRRWYEPISDQLVSASGMGRDIVQGRYFCHSEAGNLTELAGARR
jgi:hypothetical protein